MDPTTRAYALRAAAKAALTFSLTACGGVTQSPDPSDKKEEGAITADAAMTRSDVSSPRTDANDSTETGPCHGLVADAAVAKDAFACCLTFLEDGAAAGAAATKGGQSCCGAVVRYVDHATDVETAYVSAEPVLGTCCSTLRPAVFGAACTPWGPPAPPAMPSEVA